MHKEAWVNTMASLVLGALCLFLRWLQDETIFDAETGLARANAPISWLLALALLAALAAVWLLSRRLSGEGPTEPEEALADAPKILSAGLIAAGLAAAGGSALLYFTGSGVLIKIAALLGLLSVPALMFYPSLPRWGALGALLSLNPVLFFSFWIIISYKEHAVNPVVWSYATLILAIAALLLASYRLAGYLFYRAKPRQAVFACCLAPVYGISMIVDDLEGAARLIVGAWAVGMLLILWLLIRNMRPPETEAETETETGE